MTIEVISHSTPEPVQAKADEVKEVKESKSAPVVEIDEQDSAESDPANTEASDETDKDDSEVDGSDEELDAKDTEKDKPKKKGGFQRRIDKLNARNASEKAAAQQEVEYWKAEALKNAGEPKTETKVETPKIVDQAGKPDPDTFDTHVEYVEALTDWKIEQREKSALEKARTTQLETEHGKLLKSHSERVKTFSEKTENFDEVLETVNDIRVSPTVQEMIVSSENGPELMFELAKNRAEFERINKLSPLAAARELGKIEAKLAGSTESKPETKKQTKAPAPIVPVSSKGGSMAKSIHDPELSQAEYERIRAKQRSAS